MKWIIWAVVAVAAVMHWGLMGAMWMSVALAVMLENEPSRNKEGNL